MGALFKALGGGLEGLERGLLLRHDLKREAADRQIAEQDRALMLEDRAMRQKEMELRMKQAGLALEQAEFDHQRTLAMGTPQEQADRELAERQAEIQRDIEAWSMEQEKHASDLAVNEAQIRASDALANYRETGGGGGRGEKDTTFADAMKVIEGQIRQYDAALDDAELAGDKERANFIRSQLVELRNQHELLANSQLAEMGLPMGMFGIGSPQPDAPATETEAPSREGLLDRVNRATAEGGYMGGLRETFKPLHPLANLAGMISTGQMVGGGPIQQTASGDSVVLNRLGEEQIAKARAMGLLQNLGIQPQQQQANPTPQPNLLNTLFGMGMR